MIKQRNIALCIVFSIITFGIYALYWFVCLTNDANQESGQTDATSGGVALLLTIVTCNIYGWFWAYKMGEKIDVSRQETQAYFSFCSSYVDLESCHTLLCRIPSIRMHKESNCIQLYIEKCIVAVAYRQNV